MKLDSEKENWKDKGVNVTHEDALIIRVHVGKEVGQAHDSETLYPTDIRTCANDDGSLTGRDMRRACIAAIYSARNLLAKVLLKPGQKMTPDFLKGLDESIADDLAAYDLARRIVDETNYETADRRGTGKDTDLN